MELQFAIVNCNRNLLLDNRTFVQGVIINTYQVPRDVIFCPNKFVSPITGSKKPPHVVETHWIQYMAAHDGTGMLPSYLFGRRSRAQLIKIKSTGFVFCCTAVPKCKTSHTSYCHPCVEIFSIGCSQSYLHRFPSGKCQCKWRKNEIKNIQRVQLHVYNACNCMYTTHDMKYMHIM